MWVTLMQRCSTLLLAIAASFVPLASQMRVPGTQIGFYSETNGESGYLACEAPNWSWLAWRVLSGSSAGATSGVTLPFDIPGSPVFIGSRVFLVPGRNSLTGHGWIAKVQIHLNPNPSVAILETTEYAPVVDPYKVCYNDEDGYLYLLDFAAKRVLAAPYSASLPLPAFTAFEQVADAPQLPQLGITWYTVALKKYSGSGATISSRHHPHGHYYARKVSGAWQVTWESSPMPKFTLDIVNQGRLSSTGPISVGGFVGTAFLREVATNYIVAQVQMTQGNQFFELPIGSSTMLPGQRYEIGVADNPQVVPFNFTALVRHGVPQRIAEVEMNPGSIDKGGHCYVGNSTFAVAGLARSVLPGAKTVSAYLWMGARRADGTDPVVDIVLNGQTVTVLSQVDAIVGPFALELRDEVVHGYLYVPIPIPSDLNLVGGVPLWQWAALAPNGQVAVSDVFGAKIMPPPVLGLGTGGSSSAREQLRGNYPSVSPEQESATRRWAASLPSGELTPEKVAVRRIVLRRE